MNTHKHGIHHSSQLYMNPRVLKDSEQSQEIKDGHNVVTPSDFRLVPTI